jgi:hypothetical protein
VVTVLVLSSVLEDIVGLFVITVEIVVALRVMVVVVIKTFVALESRVVFSVGDVIVIPSSGRFLPIRNKSDEQKQAKYGPLLVGFKTVDCSEHKAVCESQIPGRLHIPINNNK